MSVLRTNNFIYLCNLISNLQLTQTGKDTIKVFIINKLYFDRFVMSKTYKTYLS